MREEENAFSLAGGPVLRTPSEPWTCLPLRAGPCCRCTRISSRSKCPEIFRTISALYTMRKQGTCPDEPSSFVCGLFLLLLQVSFRLGVRSEA